MTTKRLLTEAEILTMSEKDYMNEDQLAFFKNKLEQLQAEILRNAGQTTENLRETVIVPDPADRATIEEEHALELRTRDRERKLLKKIGQSLARHGIRGRRGLHSSAGLPGPRCGAPAPCCSGAGGGCPGRSAWRAARVMTKNL